MQSLPRRKPLRLPGHDYRTPAFYFITVCVQDRRMLLGGIEIAGAHPNQAGQMVHRWWNELPNKFPSIRLDTFVVMPNHIHGLLAISNVPAGAEMRPEPANLLPLTALPSLSRILQWFKTMTTNDYFRRVRADGWPVVRHGLWQRNYFEHIVRSPKSLDRFRNYIADNPRRWASDTENPSRSPDQADGLEAIIADDLAMQGSSHA